MCPIPLSHNLIFPFKCSNFCLLLFSFHVLCETMSHVSQASYDKGCLKFLVLLPLLSNAGTSSVHHSTLFTYDHNFLICLHLHSSLTVAACLTRVLIGLYSMNISSLCHVILVHLSCYNKTSQTLRGIKQK